MLEKLTIAEIVQYMTLIIASIGTAIGTAFGAYKLLLPVLIQRREAKIKNKREEIELDHIEAKNRFDMAAAADKRISDGLRRVVEYQQSQIVAEQNQHSKEISELKLKYEEQQKQLMDCVQDRASLRTQVNMQDERIKSLEEKNE